MLADVWVKFFSVVVLMSLLCHKICVSHIFINKFRKLKVWIWSRLWWVLSWNLLTVLMNSFMSCTLWEEYSFLFNHVAYLIFFISKHKETNAESCIWCWCIFSATFNMAVTLWWALIIQVFHQMYTQEGHHYITSQPSQHINHMMPLFSPCTILFLGTGLWQPIFHIGTNMCNRRYA
jgi:hypothetical protein